MIIAFSLTQKDRLLKLIKLLLAIILLLISLAPANAQTTYPAVPNFRFTDNAGTLAWDKPAGAIYFDVEYKSSDRDSGNRRFVSSVRSWQIWFFDPLFTWQARIRGLFLLDDGNVTPGPWTNFITFAAYTPTPSPTPTPAGSVACENEIVNSAYQFTCEFTLLNSDADIQAIGWMDLPNAAHPVFGYEETNDNTLTVGVLPDDCGQTLSGHAIAFAHDLSYIARTDFSHTIECPTLTPTKTPTATDTPTDTPTATPLASGSVSCENDIVDSAYQFTCRLTLTERQSLIRAVGWFDQPGSAHRIFGYQETNGRTITSSVLPEDCNQTISGGAIAFDARGSFIAELDFSHVVKCPTLTPSPTATATPTATLKPLLAPRNLRQIVESTVAWDAVAGAVAYVLEWSPAIKGETDEIVWGLQYTIPNMQTDVTYTMRVQAVGIYGEYENTSDWSDELQFLIVPSPTPTATDTPTADRYTDRYRYGRPIRPCRPPASREPRPSPSRRRPAPPARPIPIPSHSPIPSRRHALYLAALRPAFGPCIKTGRFEITMHAGSNVMSESFSNIPAETPVPGKPALTTRSYRIGDLSARIPAQTHALKTCLMRRPSQLTRQ